MEVELKLLVAPEDLTRVERHLALKGMRHWAARREHLATVYYDTPDFALARGGVQARLGIEPAELGARIVRWAKDVGADDAR